MGYDDFMLKPSHINDIWKNSKVKVAMFNFMSNYFKPRTSYEPERVEYNALNILADYQCYNLEFSKNELNLSDAQTAVVLHMFWTLLEFDPDSEDDKPQLDLNTVAQNPSPANQSP
jgi:hypothetical protein